MAPNGYEQYYTQQARQSGNGLPVFIGGKSQRGNGLGGVLSGLARMIVPVLKRGGKSILKETLRTGVDILGDVAEGRNLKTSAKKRASEGGTRLLHKASGSLITPPGRRAPIKRKTPTASRQSTVKRRKNNPSAKKPDIFE